MQYILKDNSIVESIPMGRIKAKIGDRKNRLTICDRGPNPKSKKTQVICKCDCGKYICINLQDFKENKVKSCGCLRAEQNNRKPPRDWTSPTYNTNPFYEYIQEIVDKKIGRQRVYIIKCRKCGKLYEGAPVELISNRRQKGMNPCSCWRKQSHGVDKICNILTQLKIDFIQEKTYDDLISPKGSKLRFDFYLPKYNILIEYDGQHHYQETFGQNQEKLLLQQQYDKLKEEWCIKNNIPLIRIPYYEYEKISEQYIKEKIDGKII